MDAPMGKERKDSCATDMEKAPDFSRWFSVSGDVDDFIYYGQNEKMHSER